MCFRGGVKAPSPPGCAASSLQEAVMAVRESGEGEFPPIGSISGARYSASGERREREADES